MEILIVINLVLTLITLGVVIFLLKESGDIRENQKSMMSKIVADIYEIKDVQITLLDLISIIESFQKELRNLKNNSEGDFDFEHECEIVSLRAKVVDLERELGILQEYKDSATSTIQGLENKLQLKNQEIKDLMAYNKILEKDNQKLTFEVELLKIDEVDENVEPVEIEEEKSVDLVKLVDYTYDSENDGIDKLVNKIKDSLIHHPERWKKSGYELAHESGLEIWTGSQGGMPSKKYVDYLHRVVEIWKPERISLSSSQKEILVPLIVKVINKSLNNQASQIEL